MNVFLLLMRQSLNRWRQAGWPARLQALFIWVFLVGGASHYLHSALLARWSEPKLFGGLLLFFTGWFLLQAAYLLPVGARQQLPLSLLHTLPLSTGDLHQFLLYTLWRSWRWGWAALIIFFAALLRHRLDLALLFAAQVLPLLLACSFALPVFFLRFGPGRTFYLIVWSGALLLVPVWWLGVPALWLWTLALAGLAALVRPQHGRLNRLYPLALRRFERGRRRSSPAKGLWSLLFRLHLAAFWRNGANRRLQAATLLLVPCAAWVSFGLLQRRALAVFSLFVFALAWWHYSQYFKADRALRQPEWFVRSRPLPFAPYFFSRLSAEFLFVVLYLLLFSLALWWQGTPPAEHWQLLLFLLLACAAVLLTMLIFQLLFFDDLRTAGYAFHLTILLFSLLTLWDRLVGPLVALVFLSISLFQAFRLFRS